MSDFVTQYLEESRQVIERLDASAIERVAQGLARQRDGGGRLFILGVGGSAGHASHAVNDFRKICDIEAYAPTDNVSELTARVNDDGWDTSFSAWLEGSRLRSDDAVLVFSVGGGDVERAISANLVRAVEGSLTRLGVERIDVLYLDASLDETTNLEDTLATTEWLRDAGKIASVGAFSFAPERLVEARILASAGYPRLDVLDEPYNLVRRTAFEGDLRLVAAAQGLAVTPSHALEHGFLSGQHRSKSAMSGVRGQQLRSQLNRRGIRVLRALDVIAAELSVPVAAVSIAWLLAQRTVVAPIVNAFATTHVDELMQGAGITLSRAQIAELTRAGA